MKPAKFDYIRAKHADEAVALLAEYGDDARILAGGQSLMPMLNMRLAQPAVLIDISQCDDLNFIRSENNELRVGAATKQAALEWRKELAVNSPLLALAFPHISHFQIRNRGTVCGSIAHADPSAELPLCLVALGGSVALRTRHGSRTVAANDFFQGVLTTAREPDELIEAVHFPLAKPQTRYGFAEFSHTSRRLRHRRHRRGCRSRWHHARCRRNCRSACEPILARCFRRCIGRCGGTMGGYARSKRRSTYERGISAAPIANFGNAVDDETR